MANNTTTSSQHGSHSPSDLESTSHKQESISSRAASPTTTPASETAPRAKTISLKEYTASRKQASATRKLGTPVKNENGKRPLEEEERRVIDDAAQPQKKHESAAFFEPVASPEKTAKKSEDAQAVSKAPVITEATATTTTTAPATRKATASTIKHAASSEQTVRKSDVAPAASKATVNAAASALSKAQASNNRATASKSKATASRMATATTSEASNKASTSSKRPVAENTSSDARKTPAASKDPSAAKKTLPAASKAPSKTSAVKKAPAASRTSSAASETPLAHSSIPANVAKLLAAEKASAASQTPPLNLMSILGHYNEFCTRPYFSRVWVLQELAGGRWRLRTVGILLLCGREVYDWGCLEDTAWRLNELRYHAKCIARYNSRLDDFKVLLSMQVSNEDLFVWYLNRVSQLQCQDVRDRIYSTRALVDWTSLDQIPPVPDYKMSPVKLALQLVDMIVNISLGKVEPIARVLDLHNPLGISQVLQDLQARRQGIRSHNAPCVRYRKWCTALYHSQMVQQDVMGRPKVEFKPRDEMLPQSSSYGRADPSDLSALSAESLAARGLFHLYEGDVLAAVVCKSMQVGDIIIQSYWFDLVLRPHDDGESFVVVGDAFVAGGFELAKRAPFVAECSCGLSRARVTDCDAVDIEIAIELSNEEALTAVLSRRAMMYSLYDAFEYPWRGTLGEVKAGSHVFDVTAEKMDDRLSARFEKPSSAAHRAGEYYWRYQKLFWYSVLMGTGCWLSLPRKGTS